jgi:hypothetical protein
MTIGALENAIARPDITLKTGSNDASKGILKQATGWKKTTGSDAETVLGFQW